MRFTKGVGIIALLFLAWPSHAQTIRIRVVGGSKPVAVAGRELQVAGDEVLKFIAERVIEDEKEIWKLTETVTAPQLEGAPPPLGKPVKRLRKITEPSFEVTGHDLKVNGVGYPSPLAFHGGSRDKINVVVSLPLEEYVIGVVAGEMPSSWPMEALMAQAVASRSYVLAQLAAQGHQLFDTDSSQFNQVFKWIKGEDAIPRVRDAVKRTEGTILTDGNQPLWAYYHADCGGHTEEPHAVWNNHQFYGTARDLSCPAKPNSNWEADIDLSLLNRKLAPVVDSGKKIVAVDVGESSKTGRVKNMLLKLEDGGVQKIRGNQFREKLGFSWIKSTLFGIKREGTNYHLSGRGFGHGVGLCQWGSHELAKKGKSYLAILKTYYPSAKIEKGKQIP